LNVLNIEMMREMVSVLGGLASDGEARVLMIHAERGKCFSAGVDVAEHQADTVRTMLETFHGLFRKLWELDIPTVSVVHGSALGGGFELALAADVTFAAEDAKLGQPETRVGVFPPLAAVLLPDLVGYKRTLDLLLSGRGFSAREALECGMVQRVLPAGTLFESARKYARDLAGLSRPVLGACKRAVRRGLRIPLEAALEEAERIYLNELMRVEDAHEGLSAFTQKRKPEWKHR
jgi:cyclohexa-1,5-dienecarbonyl-CoA hydratase